ncbi:hypothetical protein Tco_1070085 [Tanacetum coccineum]|uniref:Uncharacterized protein n=1 Tax=Tanacetum coccineum TaxID=301880 RepID=A0ABQ5HKC4_9ASTR
MTGTKEKASAKHDMLGGFLLGKRMLRVYSQVIRVFRGKKKETKSPLEGSSFSVYQVSLSNAEDKSLMSAECQRSKRLQFSLQKDTDIISFLIPLCASLWDCTLRSRARRISVCKKLAGRTMRQWSWGSWITFTTFRARSPWLYNA